MTQSDEIPQGTIVLFVNSQPSHWHFLKETPQTTALAGALESEDEQAEMFVFLAEFAATTYQPTSSPLTDLEHEWLKFFGIQKKPLNQEIGSGIRGTLIFPTRKNTFVYEIIGTERFTPLLTCAFWRKRNTAEALAFLAEFAAQTYPLSEIQRARLENMWNFHT